MISVFLVEGIFINFFHRAAGIEWGPHPSPHPNPESSGRPVAKLATVARNSPGPTSTPSRSGQSDGRRTQAPIRVARLRGLLGDCVVSRKLFPPRVRALPPGSETPRSRPRPRPRHRHRHRRRQSAALTRTRWRRASRHHGHLRQARKCAQTSRRCARISPFFAS